MALPRISLRSASKRSGAKPETLPEPPSAFNSSGHLPLSHSVCRLAGEDRLALGTCLPETIDPAPTLLPPAPSQASALATNPPDVARHCDTLRGHQPVSADREAVAALCHLHAGAHMRQASESKAGQLVEPMADVSGGHPSISITRRMCASRTGIAPHLRNILPSQPESQLSNRQSIQLFIRLRLRLGTPSQASMLTSKMLIACIG